jgi:Na+-driven multidrug efflux pump
MADNSLVFIFFIIGLGLSVFVGRYGEKKGFPFARGFFLSLLLSPILGAIIIGFMQPKPKK